MKDLDELNHNRIVPTADLVSYFRAFSDIPYVKEIAEMTHAKDVAQEILGEGLDSSMYLAVMSEARFKKINIHAKEYKNILEVAIGRSPRDLIFTQDPTVSYVATDLSDSLEDHREIIQKLIAEHGLSRPDLLFAAVNALDRGQMQKAVELMPPGPVAIISEGFMVYLTRDEKRAFLKNVRSILSEREGCLITSDLLIIPRNVTSGTAAQDSIEKISGRNPSDQSFESEEEAKIFIHDCGFDFQIFVDAVSITSIKELGLENDPRTPWILKSPVWALSLKK